MNTDLNRKIIHFSGSSRESLPATCEVCGTPWQTASYCQTCALRLMDVALSDDPLDEAPIEDVLPVTGDKLPRAIRRYYDHYEICQTPDKVPWELGRGAMGITYKAVDMNLGCPVALKIINTRSLAGSAARERLLKEARTAAQLRHLNIASIFHLGLDDENCYYSMEYIEGETLESYVHRAGKLPLQTALDITMQVARALRVAHKQNFIHRDIKPSNIMVVHGDSAADLIVKLIDFGLVKALSEEGLTTDWNFEGYFAGTPFYASPEQLDAGTVDARSDIYSLGKCLCYMLAGQVPAVDAGFVDERTDSRKFGMSFDGPDERYPMPITDLLRSMLAIDPNARPQKASDLIQRIQQCLAAVKNRPGRLRRGLLIVGLMVVAIASVSAGIFYTRSTSFHDSARQPESPAITDEAKLLCARGDEFYYQHSKASNQRAIELYSSAIAKSPAFADAHAGLASTYFQSYSRYGAPASIMDEAVTSAQRAIAIDPQRPRGYVALGIIRTIQGRHWEALTQLRQALEVAPQYYPAMYNFALCWCLVGRPQMALPWSVAASKLEPSNTGAWLSAADASVDLCADAQAEKFYRRCMELKPGWLPAHCGLTHLHFLQGNFAQARQDCEVAESIEPDTIHVLTLKSQIEFFSGDYSAAEVIYRHLLTMNRHGQVTYYSGISFLSALGYLRQQAGDLVESKALLSEAATLHAEMPEGPQSIYDLAAIRAIEGKQGEALVLLQQAIAAGWMDYRATLLDPRFSSIREAPAFRTVIDALKMHVAEMRVESEQRCAKPLDLADFPVQTSH